MACPTRRQQLGLLILATVLVALWGLTAWLGTR
jgi:hypothetical protein